MLRICPGYRTEDGGEPTHRAVGSRFASNKKSPIKGLDIAVLIMWREPDQPPSGDLSGSSLCNHSVI
ncbi:hypothetical protein OA42_03130 [Klebsiella michiganensis]|nr:hypothetical protein OA42_03130 [Klebsiella michiganensis]